MTETLEMFRNVLLVALLLGLAWVLFRRMAFAMRKHETPPGIVELSGAGVVQQGEVLQISADIAGAGVDGLKVTVEAPGIERPITIHDGPMNGGHANWRWPVPEEWTGRNIEVKIEAPRSQVVRRVLLQNTPSSL